MAAVSGVGKLLIGDYKKSGRNLPLLEFFDSIL
jgi:hypothetical protein